MNKAKKFFDNIFVLKFKILPSLVTGPFRGVMVRCSRGSGGAGLILPEWRGPRGGEVPGVGDVDLK